MILTSLTTITEQPVSHNPEIKKKVMLSPGDLPHLTNFSQARFAPGQVAPGHSHANMCEVFFVEEGEGIIKVDGQDYLKLPEDSRYTLRLRPLNGSKSRKILTFFQINDNI